MATSIMGQVKRPLPGEQAKTTTITASIEKGEEIIEQVFDVVVEPWTDDEVIAVNASNLTEAVIIGGNVSVSEVVGNLVLSTVGEHGATLTWTTPNVAIISAAGVVTRPTFTQGDITLTIKAVITSNAVHVDKTFVITVKKQAQTTAEYLASYWTNTYITSLLASNTSKDSIVSDLYVTPEPGVSVVITSSAITRITGSGVVVRPTAVSGNAAVSLTVVFTKDSVSVTNTLNCVVLALTS